MVRLKILPTDINIDLKELEESVKSNLPGGMSVRSRSEEPIAFGIVALIMDFLVEEKEGVMEALENAVHSSKNVGQVDVVGVSRLSTGLK